MATNTPNLQLRKPDPDPVTGDDVDVNLDLNANWDKIDTAVQDALDGGVSTTVVTRIANSSAFTTTEVVLDTLTFAAVDGQKYKIVWDGAFHSTVAGDLMRGRIRETNVSGTTFQVRQIEAAIASQGFPVRMEFFWTASATANKTFVATGLRAVGTGSVTSQGTAEIQTSFYAEKVNS